METTLKSALLAVVTALAVTSVLAASPGNLIALDSKKIVVGVHESYPWSYGGPDHAIAGIEREIIEEAFKSQNIDVRFKIFSYSRLIIEFQKKNLDFASPIALDIPGAVYTERYLPFHDVAVTLKAKNVKLDQLSDLEGKSVVAYQQANKVLGSEFNAVVHRGKYQEFADRDIQINMLFNGRADAVVGETRISSCLAEKSYGRDLVAIHPIFTQISYGGAAWEQAVVDQFQAGLKAIKQSGVYQKILSKPCPLQKQTK